MKSSVFSILVILGVAITTGLFAQQTPNESRTSHLGTWELKSHKYGGGEQQFSEYSGRRIKLITATHFTWVEVEATTKMVQAAAGGACSLSGETYTESIDFGLGMDTYLGQKHTFTVRVEDDKLFLSGALSDGLKIEEVWQRVKNE